MKNIIVLLVFCCSFSSLGAHRSDAHQLDNIILKIGLWPMTIDSELRAEEELSLVANDPDSLHTIFGYLKAWLNDQDKIGRAGILLRVLLAKYPDCYSDEQLCHKMIDFYNVLIKAYCHFEWSSQMADAYSHKDQWTYKLKKLRTHK